jgi:hypothetical protein
MADYVFDMSERRCGYKVCPDSAVCPNHTYSLDPEEAYRAGVDVIDYAVIMTEVELSEPHWSAYEPLSGISGSPKPSNALLARRIIGLLMNAGWTPPAPESDQT